MSQLRKIKNMKILARLSHIWNDYPSLFHASSKDGSIWVTIQLGIFSFICGQQPHGKWFVLSCQRFHCQLTDLLLLILCNRKKNYQIIKHQQRIDRPDSVARAQTLAWSLWEPRCQYHTWPAWVTAFSSGIEQQLLLHYTVEITGNDTWESSHSSW